MVLRFKGAWFITGGTSVSSPLVAGIVNARGSFRASSEAELSFIYSRLGTSTFNDVQRGRCGVNSRFPAGFRWDYCTGVGTPHGTGGF